MFLDKMIKYSIFILILIGLGLPLFVNAGFLSGPIVPCGTRASGVDCTLCHIFEMGRNIIQFIWELILVIAPVFILIGGIMILTAGAKPDQVSLGKKIIFNAIIGVVIALLAWTVLNMIFNTLVSSDVPPWPWNKPQCKGGGVEEEVVVEEGEYCVCEVPVYDLNPNDYPSQASVIGRNIKATKLADKDTCEQGCVSGNANTYCPSTLTPSKANLYCADEIAIKSKQTCAVKLSRDPQCRISTGQCWSDALQCAATVTPGAPQLNSAYVKRCFLNGQSLCSYIEWSNGATYCPQKAAGPCTSEKPYTLYRFAEESSREKLDALTCSKRYYGNTDYVCRLNCQYDSCSAPLSEDWCQRSAPAGSENWKLNPPPGGADEEQKGDASPRLASLLNCMYNKIPNLGINSISHNSLCGDPACDTSQSGCGHTANSCHFGGSNCTGQSYAVDFDTSIKCSDIKTAALQCDSTAWVNWENSHTHVSVNNTACGCNESGSGTSCPN